MKKQALARSLIRALADRIALDAALGAQVQPAALPPQRDLSRVLDPDDEAPAAAAPGPAERQATKPAADPAPPARVTVEATPAPPPVSASELGQAAGVGQGSLLELPPVANKEGELAPIRDQALGCTKCRLCEDRRHVVFGEGDLETDLVFVGEAPGADEDRTGRPFVGRAGELLTAMIEKGMQRPRGSVYICNILKCHPPRNRDPEPREVGACTPYLHEQLRIIRPKLIVCLGRISSQILSGERLSMKRLRGRLLSYRGIPLLPTYHPAYLLRVRKREGRGNQADRDTWEDLQKAMAFLEREA